MSAALELLDEFQDAEAEAARDAHAKHVAQSEEARKTLAADEPVLMLEPHFGAQQQAEKSASRP